MIFVIIWVRVNDGLMIDVDFGYYVIEFNCNGCVFMKMLLVVIYVFLFNIVWLWDVVLEGMCDLNVIEVIVNVIVFL